jgi:hypothetical protein
MKTIASFNWIAAGLLLVLPGISFTQNIHQPPQSKATMHQEVPDDPYVPLPPGTRRTGMPASYIGTGFTMVQVNVDGNGQNILGDAANEPSLAINPTDHNQIVIGWRQFDDVGNNFRQAGWGYSLDAGQTWTFPGVIEPGIFRSDPVLDVDADGIYFYNSLTSNSGIYTCKVFKSTDGGASWNAGAEARGGDKQWMTIDRTSGIGSGNIYSSWTSYYSSCYPEFFTRSTDGGAFFESCVEIPGNPYWGTLAVGNNGELYVVGNGEWGGLMVAKSISAQDPGSPTTWDFAMPVDLDAYLLAGLAVNPVGLVGQANIDVDRSNGPGRDNVYVLASAARLSNGDSSDVMFAKSTDGGLTWGLPQRINDDASTTNYQWFGTMSVAPNGRIDAVWLDTRDAGANPFISALYYSFSLDQGETWSANEKLSASFDPHLGWPQQEKMGDYFEMESNETSALLAWSNTLNGEQDVYYSVITPDITGIDDGRENDKFYSVSASPDPFRDRTTITYKTPVECYIQLSLLNIYGKQVRTMVSRTQPAGTYAVDLPAGDLPAGYYLCRMNAGAHTKTISVVKVN